MWTHSHWLQDIHKKSVCCSWVEVVGRLSKTNLNSGTIDSYWLLFRFGSANIFMCLSLNLLKQLSFTNNTNERNIQQTEAHKLKTKQVTWVTVNPARHVAERQLRPPPLTSSAYWWTSEGPTCWWDGCSPLWSCEGEKQRLRCDAGRPFSLWLAVSHSGRRTAGRIPVALCVDKVA